MSSNMMFKEISLKTKYNKLIFLDIDGVLVTRLELMSGLKLDRNHMFNKNALFLLDSIVDKTCADIIISSTWRFGKTVEDLRLIFKNRGFKNINAIQGITPRKFDNETIRGDEIQFFLNKYPANKFCIIDDDSDMLESQKPFFIKTDFETGLRINHMEKAIFILNS